MCGAAVAMLGISADTFYHLSPAEFYYAVKAKSEDKKADIIEAYEVARFQAMLVINYTSTILKKPIEKPQDLTLFTWEEHPNMKKQSQEEMKRAVQKIALMLGTKPEQEKVINTK